MKVITGLCQELDLDLGGMSPGPAETSAGFVGFGLLAPASNLLRKKGNAIWRVNSL